MLEIETWSKEKVHAVMLELLYSFNYMWFLMENWMRKNCPEKLDSEDVLKLSEEFGSYEAYRLAKVLLDTGTGVEKLEIFTRHSHWCAFEDIELTKVSAKTLRMSTFGCTTQKAAQKWGMNCYECGKNALRLRQGFFSRIDSAARVIRIFTPPDDKPRGIPEEVSCHWLITIE